MIRKVKVDCHEPLNMEFEYELKNLQIFVGPNGSGKSFIQLVYWYLYLILGVLTRLPPQALTVDNARAFANKIAKYTFRKDVDITITFLNEYNEEYSVSIRKEGDDIDVQFELNEGWLEVFKGVSRQFFKGVPIYLSRDVRQFTAIEAYLRIKSLVGINTDDPDFWTKVENEEKLEKICEIYPLYDVIAMEKIILNFKRFNQGELKEEFNVMKSIDSSFANFIPQRIEIENNTVIGVYDNGERKNLAYESAGMQALLIIALATL